MYILFIVLIFIASAILILAVLAQNPKGGMAANFGASNQVMGARQTADFLEKLTWGLAIAILVFSLAATMAMPRKSITDSNLELQNKIMQSTRGASDIELPFDFSTTGSGEATESTEATEDAQPAPAENSEEAAQTE